MPAACLTLTAILMRRSRIHRRRRPSRSRRRLAATFAFDGPTHRERSRIRQESSARLRLPGALPLTCPAITISATIRRQVGPPPSQPATEHTGRRLISVFGEDRWRFDAAGWSFIGLNSPDHEHRRLPARPSNSIGLPTQLVAAANGKPVALFIHKPLYLNSPDRFGTRRQHRSRLTFRCRRGFDLRRDAARRRPAAGRQRPRSSAPGFHLWTYLVTCLGAVSGLHHSSTRARCEAAAKSRSTLQPRSSSSARGAIWRLSPRLNYGRRSGDRHRADEKEVLSQYPIEGSETTCA